MKKELEVTQYIRSLRGDSQSVLVNASDGRIYVAKLIDNDQALNLHFNESAGTELYRACGLATPPWKSLLITDDFLNRNRDLWPQGPKGRLRPASGQCFGSLFMDGGSSRLLEILPGNSFRHIRNRASFWLAWMVDICAEQANYRQAIFVERPERNLKAYFVDHNRLFVGSNERQRLNYQASLYLDSRIYPDTFGEQGQDLLKFTGTLDVDRLWRKIQTLPGDWKTTSALNSFARCLCRLSNLNMLHDVLDEMVDELQRIRECALAMACNDRRPPMGSTVPEVRQRQKSNSATHFN